MFSPLFLLLNFLFISCPFQLCKWARTQCSGVSVKETLPLCESIQCCCIDVSLSVVLSAHGTVAKLMGLYTILNGSLEECLKLQRLRLNLCVSGCIQRMDFLKMLTAITQQFIAELLTRTTLLQWNESAETDYITQEDGQKKLELYGKQTKNEKQLTMSIFRDPGILRSLPCSDSEFFCSFSCWFKTFVLFTCTVNAVHPLPVGEI